MKYFTKNVFILPLLGFLAAGCTSSSNLQSSDVDDVYFSSEDKVTYVEPVYTTRAQESTTYQNDEYAEDIEGRVSDPQTYAESSRRSNNNPYQYSYYDAPFGNPYYAYHDPFYSPSRYYSRAVLMDPWFDPYYDPFYGPSLAIYDPFWPRYRSGISISIGMGYGRPYNPWGYGYGRHSYYNPYRPGYGGHYDGYPGGVIAGNHVNYAPRSDRSSNTGQNPNISRDGRNNSTIAPERGRTTRSGRTEQEQINRPRTSPGQAYPGSETQPTRTRRNSAPASNQVRTAPNSDQPRTSPAPTRTREIRTSQPARSSEGSSNRPTRRERNTPAPAVQRESTPTRSQEPASRPSVEPSRSSSGSSGSSGSSSSGRRGRN